MNPIRSWNPRSVKPLVCALAALALVRCGGEYQAEPPAAAGHGRTAQSLGAGAPQLLVDFNAVVPSTGPGASIGDAVVWNGVMYFSATETASGNELWRSDGTAAGTWLVADINAGTSSSSPEFLTVFDGELYFAATDGIHGVELWKTDGTGPGTVRLSDINAGSSSANPESLTPVGNTLFFTATNGTTASAGGMGEELYKTDGTPGGTVLVKDVNPGTGNSSAANLTAVGNTLFFSASNGTTAASGGVGTELWKSDGTEAGTEVVLDINPGTSSGSPNNFIALGNVLLFSATNGTTSGVGSGRELWVSDGTPAGTQLLKDINVGTSSSSPTNMTLVGNTVFFDATNGTSAASGGVGTELWKTDGTAAGTMLVKDINAGTSGSSPSNFVALGNTLFFRATTGTTGAGTGIELWKSDGTEAGTVQVADINPGTSSSSPTNMTAAGTRVFFTASDGTHGTELWVTDGTTAGTSLVTDLNPGSISASPGNLSWMGTVLLFSATDGTMGSELWRTDGTLAGTSLVQDLNPHGTGNATPTNLTAVGSRLFYDATDGTTGSELVVTDGTVAGTQLFELYPGTTGASPNNMMELGGVLLFSATTGTTAGVGSGREPWLSDGTLAGTQILVDINVGTGSSTPTNLTKIGNTVFFDASNGTTAASGGVGTELWKTDGTAAGTVLVKDINPGTANSSPSNFVAVGNTLYFRATTGTAAGVGNGIELWKSDGTEPGTVQVKDINTGTASSSPTNMTALGNLVFFSANDGTHGSELWKSDGTEPGTLLVLDINAGSTTSSISSMVALGSEVFFSANDGTSGDELWKSDGTAAGTLRVRDILPGAGGSSPEQLTVLGNHVYFMANDGVAGQELWRTDGTEPGTVLVRDILPGARGSSISGMAVVGNLLVFAADDGVHGLELWESDGTSAGTVLVADVNPGPRPSSPAFFTQAGQNLYFAATTDLGRELYVLSLIPPGDDTTPPVITCPPAQTFYAQTAAGTAVTFAEATATDDVTANPTLTYAPARGSTFAAGITSVTATAADASGNTAGCTFTVEVLVDATPPSVTCPADIADDTTSAGGKAVTFAAAVATDDSPVAPELGYSHASGDLFAVGTTTVTVTATDAAGNTAACSFDVVLAFTDITAPQVTCPATQNRTSNDVNGVLVTFAAATATDDSGDLPTMTYSQASGTLFPVGTTSVTVTATDGTGNEGACTFDVVVTFVDITAPTVSCPADQTAVSNAAAGVAVTFPAATATDDSGAAPVITYSHASGDVFPVGTTTVTATATDAAGNADTCTFAVEVGFDDITAPVVTCPADLAVDSNSVDGTAVTYPAAIATDDSGDAPSLVYSHASGDVFALGTTTVTVTATDGAGNDAGCTFDVVVTFVDVTAPVLTCPANVARGTNKLDGTEVDYPAATATDDSGEAPSLTYSKASGAVFPVGTTTVTVTATDGADNEATCTFDVVLTFGDDTAPAVTCPEDVTVVATGAEGAVVAYAAATASDDSGEAPALSYSHASGETFAVGATVVTTTAADAAGNEGTCTFTVTVTELPEEETGGGCGCASTSGNGLGLVFALGFAGLAFGGRSRRLRLKA